MKHIDFCEDFSTEGMLRYLTENVNKELTRLDNTVTQLSEDVRRISDIVTQLQTSIMQEMEYNEEQLSYLKTKIDGMRMTVDYVHSEIQTHTKATHSMLIIKENSKNESNIS